MNLLNDEDLKTIGAGEILSINEFDTIVLSAVRGRECTDEELHLLYIWSVETKVRSAILQTILDGGVAVLINDDGCPIYDHDFDTGEQHD